MRTVLLWLFVVVGLAMPAAAAMAQPAQARCTSAYGQTVCGYECKAAYGELRCAQTPWGTCTAAFGKVVCSDGAPQLVHCRGPLQKVECKSAFGEIACGYDCKAAFGEVKCAQTPEGTCQASFGELTCWDPQPTFGRSPVGHHPRARVLQDQEKATCTSAYGQTACGYDCKAAYGEVKCAQTPRGTCVAQYGEITCFDPAR